MNYLSPFMIKHVDFFYQPQSAVLGCLMSKQCNVPFPLVSIVIPIYGVERFLPACLDNVCNQTYSHLEIILIDDGSPDRCGEICDEYARKDARIVVHHVANGGVGAARNIGLDAARGEFVLCIDPDDIPETTYVETAMNAAWEYGCDIVTGRFRWIDENGNPYQYDSPHNRYDSLFVLTRDEAVDQIFHNRMESFPWIYLIKRELWNSPKTRFPRGRVFEDAATMYKIIANSTKVVKLPNTLYSYRYRRSLATNSSGKRLTLAAAENSMERLVFINGTELPDAVRRDAIINGFNMLIACYYDLLRRNDANDAEINHVKSYVRQYAPSVRDMPLPKCTSVRWMLMRFHMEKPLLLIDAIRRG
ncbi:glycosyltransferase family 2 protein [Bifidobacterium sp. 82T10]|uniref:Glycosyltransferase family 2 protein n=1 Tax=Bifidobacterium miconis TaxID=2834435 RepID=A0ABS6WCE9_9BIFI|nr:glycosyltransferase family 2 protein [Bifidobacterium miconis]MBW3091723.1 glycosyltransferase family 2 protein [Bifidobacterium miconis]